MTERGRSRVVRTACELQIGPSAMTWQNGILTIDINEVCTPLPRRMRGQIRVFPEALPGLAFTLNAEGTHVWQPIAPRARVEVAMALPHLSWVGEGYLDSNFGNAPLEAGFKSWSWSRGQASCDTAIVYDIWRHDGSQTGLALRITPSGNLSSFEPPPLRRLSSTLWGISRSVRSDSGLTPHVRNTLENAPFYTRSLVETSLLGHNSLCFHESLSLDRFASNLVRAMLPFRMPRAVR